MIPRAGGLHACIDGPSLAASGEMFVTFSVLSLHQPERYTCAQLRLRIDSRKSATNTESVSKC